MPNFMSGAAIGAAWGELQLKKTQFDRDLDDAERHFSKTANSIERRARKFRQNMEKAFTGIAAATAGVGAAMGGAASVSAKFESQLVEVQKVTDPETMRAMKEEIEDMANVMPMAHEGLTQIAADAGRMGIEGVEALTDFTKTVSMLGVATELTAERAGKSLGRLTKWLNIPAKYAQNLGAAVNKLSNSIPADADEIVRTLGKTGQQFEILGASTTTTLALSGAVSALADSAERGGTRMRRLIQQMQEPGTITKMAKAFDMTAQGMERLIDSSPVKAIKKMAKAFKEGGTTADQLRQALASTSEVTLTILANNLDMVNEALAMTEGQLRNPTSLMKEFKAATNTTIAQLKMLGSTLKNVIMNMLGDQANKILIDFVKNMRAWALAIEDTISNNERLQNAIFGVVQTLLKIGTAITVFGLAYKAIVALLNPVTALAAAIYALGAAWYFNVWGMKDFVNNKVTEFLQNTFETTQDLVKELKKLPSEPFSSIEGLAETIKENPAEEAVPLTITGLTFHKFSLGGTITGALAGVLAAGGMGSVSTGILSIAKGFAVAITLPLIINEFTSEEKKQEIEDKWEESGLYGKVKAILNNYPITSTFGVYYGGLAFTKFAPAALSAITNQVAKHIPWLYLSAAKAGYAIKGISGPAIAIGGINLVLGMAAAQLAWEEFSVTGEGILDEIIQGVSTALAGTAAMYFGYSVLGLSGGWTAALGLGSVALVLAITKLIPDLQLGGGAAQKIRETIKSGIEDEDIEVGLSPKVYLENLRKLTKGTGLGPTTPPTTISKVAKELSEGEIDTIETNLKNFKKSLDQSDKKITDFGENVEEIIAVLNRLLQASKEGKPVTGKEGGPVGFQKGGMAGFVPGIGSGDIIPAMLEPGEFVWPKEMVKKFPGLIKGMWQGFKKGGSVSSGKHYYGPGPKGDDTGVWNTVLSTLERWSKPGTNPLHIPEEDVKNLEKFNKFMGDLHTVFKEFSSVMKDPEALTEALEEDFEALEEDLKGLTKETNIFKKSLEELEKLLKGMDVATIGKLPEALKAIMTTEKVIGQRGGVLRGPGTKEGFRTVPPEDITTRKKVEDWSLRRLQTLQTLDKSMSRVVGDLINLEEVAQKYGVAQGFVQEQIDAVRKKFKRLTGSSEAFDKALEKAREEAEKFAVPEKVKKMGNAALTVANSFMEVAEATGKLSAGMSARLGGIMSAAQSALSGNWLQAAMDLFTGFMTGWIEDLKAKKEELQKKLDTTFSMVTEGLRNLTQEINSLVGSLAGPFSDAVSGALEGFVGFFKMTQQFVQDNILEMMQTGFSALLSVITGVTSSLIGLLKKSDQWEALQAELEPIWKALADAFGTLLTPVVALARWLREYLGISKDVGEDMEEIADLNVPSGFKRARKVWEAAEPGQPVGTAGGGGGMKIPEWAKQIIQPIKNKLAPYLKGSKDFLQRIKSWSKGIWSWLQQLILKWIPQFFKFLGTVAKWVANIPWKTVFGYITMAAQWFLKNFPKAWAKFTQKLDALLKGTLGSNGFLATIQSIDRTLKAIAKAMGVGAAALGGAGIGAAIGGAVGGPMGAVIGGGIGAAVGGIAGWLGFQEGGIVTGPTPGIVGEAGPEAIIPLDRLGDFGTGNIEVTINASGDGVADQIIDDIQVKNKRLTGSRSTSAAINRRTYS